MARTFGFIAVLLAVGIGLRIYMKDAQSVMPGTTSAETTVDVIGVRNDLMAIANAERRYWVGNDKYASLEELRSIGEIYISARDHYSYSVEPTASGFKVVAVYSGPDRKAPKRMTVDETMTLKSE